MIGKVIKGMDIRATRNGREFKLQKGSVTFFAET